MVSHPIYTFHDCKRRMQKLCIKMCLDDDILSFNELNSIKVWKQKYELFHYVAIECLYCEIHGIHAGQGLGGINEMMVHIKKTNMLLLRLV